MTAFALMIMCSAIVAFFLDEIIAGLKKIKQLPGGEWLIPMAIFSILEVTCASTVSMLLHSFRWAVDYVIMHYSIGSIWKGWLARIVSFVLLVFLPVFLTYILSDRRFAQRRTVLVKKVAVFAFTGVFVFMYMPSVA